MTYVKRNNYKCIIIPLVKYMNLLYKYMLLTYFTVFSNNNNMTTSKILKQTASLRKEDIKKDWLLIDAKDIVLGRLATNVSNILRGKHKPTYSPHMDMGDHVIIVNADKVVLSRDKANKKIVYRHAGFPGGIKSRSYANFLQENPTDAVRQTIRGMLPKNRLGRQQLKKLQVYAGAEHPHSAQKPEPMELAQAKSRES